MANGSGWRGGEKCREHVTYCRITHIFVDYINTHIDDMGDWKRGRRQWAVVMDEIGSVVMDEVFRQKSVFALLKLFGKFGSQFRACERRSLCSKHRAHIP